MLSTILMGWDMSSRKVFEPLCGFVPLLSLSSFFSELNSYQFFASIVMASFLAISWTCQGHFCFRDFLHTCFLLPGTYPTDIQGNFPSYLLQIFSNVILSLSFFSDLFVKNKSTSHNPSALFSLRDTIRNTICAVYPHRDYQFHEDGNLVFTPCWIFSA